MSESRRHRSRSRDRDHDRDRSRSRSRHRSHKKKKHRRHRSRSSSVVHLNPLFAAGSSYNPHQEQEIMSLRNELYMSQSRAAALEADVNRVRHEYGVIKLELDRSRINAAGTEHKLRDSLARAVNIEKTNTQLRAQVNGQTVEIEKMKERLKFFEIEQVVSKDRVNELAKRNETVVKKCEELTTRSKTLQLERDEAIHNVCVVKQQLEDARNEVEGRKKDAQSIQEQLKAAQESETQLIAEKAEMERNMREKDVQITGERRKFNQEKRKDQETMAKLTEKLTGGLKEEIDGQICIIMGTLLGIQEQQDIQLEEMRKRVNAKMANVESNE